MDKPEMLQTFMYALVKNASRDSYVKFMEYWGITTEEYMAIEKWFRDEHGIDFWIPKRNG